MSKKPKFSRAALRAITQAQDDGYARGHRDGISAARYEHERSVTAINTVIQKNTAEERKIEAVGQMLHTLSQAIDAMSHAVIAVMK